MTADLWHYPRRALAESVLAMFTSGLSSALIFFAPRRMGKTEFLLKDIEPLAREQGWRVFYFSFLDAGEAPDQAFMMALADHAQQQGLPNKLRRLLPQRLKVGAGAVGASASFEIDNHNPQQQTLRSLFAVLAEDKPNWLLLLDEVQTLAQQESNQRFIAALRTGLDMHKDCVKVMFTGSSREGLRQMFSQSAAPFFHFGQNLDFPAMGREFTDHLADVFLQVTSRQLDKEALWQGFEQLQFVPQHIRAVVERLALNPNLSIEQALANYAETLVDQSDYRQAWVGCQPLEQALLLIIAEKKKSSLYSNETREQLAQQSGQTTIISVSAVQNALRRLQKNTLIAKTSERGGYDIDDPSFLAWLREEIKH